MLTARGSTVLLFIYFTNLRKRDGGKLRSKTMELGEVAIEELRSAPAAEINAVRKMFVNIERL